MKTYPIKTPDQEESIPMILWEKDPKRIVVFICGSGDVKESFIPIAEMVRGDNSLASFSFRGRETDNEYPPEQQAKDLVDVLRHLRDEGYTEIVLAPTSAGFISVALLTGDTELLKIIKGIIMFDPADYPLDASRGTWSGMNDFNPNSPLLSTMLDKISQKTVVNVVFFGLKNINEPLEDFYNKPPNRRGKDLENGYTRLNQKMSENIYESIPEHARGDFVINKTIPHAFSRDGDVRQNIKDLADYTSAFVEKIYSRE